MTSALGESRSHPQGPCLDPGPRWGQFQWPVEGKACCWEVRVKSGEVTLRALLRRNPKARPRAEAVPLHHCQRPRQAVGFADALAVGITQAVHARRVFQCTPGPSGKDRHLLPRAAVLPPPHAPSFQEKTGRCGRMAFCESVPNLWGHREKLHHLLAPWSPCCVGLSFSFCKLAPNVRSRRSRQIHPSKYNARPPPRPCSPGTVDGLVGLHPPRTDFQPGFVFQVMFSHHNDDVKFSDFQTKWIYLCPHKRSNAEATEQLRTTGTNPQASGSRASAVAG